MVGRIVVAMLVVGVLAGPGVAAQYQPEQIHVSLAGTAHDARLQPPDASHFAIQWSVSQPYLPSHQPQVRVKIEGSADQVLPATLTGFVRDHSPPAATEEHEARPFYGALLRASIHANVTYQVGDPSAGFSPPITFHGFPAPHEPTRLVAFGGVGYGGYSRLGVRTPGADAPGERTVSLALNLTPDVALLLGNLGGSSSNKPWNGFMKLIEPLQSQVVTVPVPGEQDDSENQYQLKERYVLPHVGDTTSSVSGEEVELTYHAFSVGSAYVIGLDSSRVCEPLGASQNSATVAPCTQGVPNTEQLEWLKGVLEDANEDLKATWIVVYLNKGPYVYGDDGDDLAVRHLWAPVFESFGVDLVLHSSEAFYQRSFPMRNGIPVSQERHNYSAGLSPVYVMSGAAGMSPATPFERPAPSWVALTNKNRTLLQVDATTESLTVRGIVTDTGEVIDWFTIRKPGVDPVAEGPANTPRPTPGVDVILLAATVMGLAAAWRRRTGGVA